jgi:hypothetical protein
MPRALPTNLDRATVREKMSVIDPDMHLGRLRPWRGGNGDDLRSASFFEKCGIARCCERIKRIFSKIDQGENRKTATGTRRFNSRGGFGARTIKVAGAVANFKSVSHTKILKSPVSF